MNKNCDTELALASITDVPLRGLYGDQITNNGCRYIRGDYEGGGYGCGHGDTNGDDSGHDYGDGYGDGYGYSDGDGDGGYGF